MKMENILDFLQRKQYLIYVAVFLLFFFLFLILRFPGEYIIETLIQQFNEKSNVKVTYSRVKFSLFSGIALNNLELSLPQQQSFKIKKVKIQPSYTSLLSGKISTFLELSDPAGKLHGKIILGGSKAKLDLTIKKLDLSALDYLAGKLHTRLSGLIRGKIKLTYPGKWEKSKGLIVLEGENIVASDNPYIAMLGKKSLQLGTLSAMGKITNGKLQIETFKLGEKNYYIKIGGDIALKTPLINSMLNLQVKLKLDQELQQKLGAFLPAAGFSRTPGGIYVKKIYGRVAFLLR